MTGPTAPQTAVEAALRAVFIDEWYALLVEVDDAVVRGGWTTEEVGTEEVFDKHRDAIERSLAAIRAKSSAETERRVERLAHKAAEIGFTYGALGRDFEYAHKNVNDMLAAEYQALAPADAAGGRERDKPPNRYDWIDPGAER